MKLLIVEDEPVLVEEIESYLTEQGYRCETSATFAVAEDKMLMYEYDVVILDITLPDGNGLQLLKQLKKERPKTGVLIVSAKNSLPDKLSGFDLGADDYITKPFYMEELNARVSAIIRRRNFNGNAVMQFDQLEIDTVAKEVSVKGEALPLTKKEYELLLYFVINKNRLLSQQSIAEHLWGDDYDMVDNFNFVYLHIKNLRKKLSGSTGQNYIQTVYGVGYKWALQ